MAVPSRPTNLKAVQNGTSAQIDLSWTDNASDETAYKVERKTDRGSWVEIKGDLAANSTSYNDTTVTIGHFYEYRIRCSNAEGNSEYCISVPIIPTKVGSFTHVKDRLMALLPSATAALSPESEHIYGNLELNPSVQVENMPIACVDIFPRMADVVYGRRTPNDVQGKMFEVDFTIYVYAEIDEDIDSRNEDKMVTDMADLIVDYLDAQALAQSAYKIHNIFEIRYRVSPIGSRKIRRAIIEGTMLTSRADA